MKLLVILLVPLTCFCQQQPGQSFVYSNSGFTWSTLYISKVDSFATCSTFKTNTVVVTDSVRGGTFVKYSGNMAVDNGMIFSDATGGKWLRQVSSDYLDIRWFGAKSDGSDTRDAFIAAINSAKANMASVKIKFPQTEDNSYYYFSDSVAIDSYVEIFGDGHESKLKFAQHKKGFVFTYPNTHYSILRDIYIASTSSSESPSNTWDSSKHGIIVKSPVYFSNIWVNGFDGCGIYIVNDLNGANPGNASTSVFNLCHSYYNLLHGIYIQGGDVNAMTFTNCDIVGNGGVGIYDKSFLGNHYSYNHIASNGSPELTTQRGLVKKDGVVYACIKDTTKNITPPNSSYWQVVNNSWIAYNSVQTYDATKTYYAVGSIILEGSNQYGTIMGNYVESDQAPGYIDQNNLNINGNIQTRNATPTTIYASSGKIRSKAAFIGEFGLSSSWLYGGDMSNYVNGYTAHPNYSGLIVGGNAKSALIKFYDNFTNIGQLYTSTNTLNTFLESGKKYVITADTVNVVGTLLNNGSELSGGGVSQSALDDTSANIRTAIATGLGTKQNTITNGSISNAMLANGAVANLSGTNTGDNAANTTYASDYRAANFIAGTDYLAPNGNGSALTGLTKSQVSLGNVDNTSDANKPVSTATQTALDGKQATLVSNTNIKTVGGQSVLGSGNIVTTNSQTFVPLAANFSSTSTTPAAVTGWSFAVTNGVTYRVQVIGAYQTAATTTGGIIGISLTGATGTVRGYAMGTIVSTAAASDLVIPIVATSGTGSTLTTTGVTAINSPHSVMISIIFICTGSGTFNIVWGTEVNASAAQLNSGSALIYQSLN